MTNTNWNEIEEKLNNNTFSNSDYLELIDNTLLELNNFLLLFRDKVIEKYPDENNRPKELQERIIKINKMMNRE